MVDLRELDAEPRHAKSRWSFLDRLMHSSRRPLSEFGFRHWLALTGSEIAFVALTVQGLAHGRLAAVGWLALALAELAVFVWYVRRPVEKP